LITSFLLALFLFIPSIAFAAGDWNEIPVSSDTYDQVNASISGSTIVWQDYRNKQAPPNIGTGCSAGRDCTAADIYALDLNGGAERRLTATWNGMDPDISGNLVAWRDWDTGRIVVYNLTDNTRVDASITATQMVTPSISGNRVVWTDYRNNTEYGDIYMRDLTVLSDTAGTPVSLGSNLPAGSENAKKDKRNPDLDGDIVVWEDMRNAYQDAQGWWHNPDIYMKNLATGVESAVCTNTGDQYNPAVAGNRVFWQDARYGNWDVFMKDLTTGVETRLTTNSAQQSWPSASGDMVVWKDAREGDEDIYLRNFANGVEQRVNTDPDSAPTASQKIPVISDGRVAWMDLRSGNWDIYTARDEVTPQVTSISPSGFINNSATTISATYSDGGTGVNTSSVAVAVDGSPAQGCTATLTRVDCPSSIFQEGSHSITVSVGDYSGNLNGDAGAQFVVDSIEPVIGPISAEVPEGTNTARVDAELSDPAPGSGVDPASVQVTLDGVAQGGCVLDTTHVACNLTDLPLGEHSVSMSVDDLSGNHSFLSRTFVVADTVAPVITDPSPVGLVPEGPLVISASFSDGVLTGGMDLSSAGIKVDGLDVAGCSITAVLISCPIDGVSEGSHQIVVTISDQAGNVGSLAWSIHWNAGPQITGLSPAAGSLVNNPTAPLSAAYSDAGVGVDDASVQVFLDGVLVGPAALTVTSSSFGYQPGWESRLADGPHTVRVIVADLLGEATEQTWSFTLVSPSLKDEAAGIYWESYAAYLRRELSVDYQISGTGAGTCPQATVAFGIASGGVVPTGFPVSLGDIASGDVAEYSLKYTVPAGVTSFRALNYTSCSDGSGNTFWPAGPLPK